MYGAKEIAKLCECSISKAYNIIRALNQKLIREGVPNEVVIAGKISKKIFHDSMKI